MQHIEQYVTFLSDTKEGSNNGKGTMIPDSEGRIL